MATAGKSSASSVVNGESLSDEVSQRTSASNSTSKSIPTSSESPPSKLVIGMGGQRNISFASSTKSGLPLVSSESSSTQGPVKKRPLQQKKKQIVSNMKKENLVLLIQKKKECEKKAHEIVMRLIDPNVEKEYLLENAISISKQHMEDVIEERRLSELCGWVLCDNRVDRNNIPKQTYQIRGHKVYDITEKKSFCNGKCYAKATHFKAQLLTSPLWLRDMEENVQFEILDDDDTKDLHGMTVTFSSVNLSDDDNEESADEDEKNVEIQALHTLRSATETSKVFKEGGVNS